MFKILSTYTRCKKYIKCNIWRAAVRPSCINSAFFFSQVVDSYQPSLEGMININGVPMFICVDDYIDRTGIRKR